MSNHYVPTEMEVDAGTVVLALVLDTLSGRSPLYRLEEGFVANFAQEVTRGQLPLSVEGIRRPGSRTVRPQ
jgi:hypothetical protein